MPKPMAKQTTLELNKPIVSVFNSKMRLKENKSLLTTLTKR